MSKLDVVSPTHELRDPRPPYSVTIHCEDDDGTRDIYYRERCTFERLPCALADALEAVLHDDDVATIVEMCHHLPIPLLKAVALAWSNWDAAVDFGQVVDVRINLARLGGTVPAELPSVLRALGAEVVE